MTAGDCGAATEAARLARDLIRIDTSNPGRGEHAAAQLVADALADIGAHVQWFEPQPGRVSVVARIPGTDPLVPPLLIHSHLDVVPAIESEWTRDPFGGDVTDGYVWGRGAVDMKGSIGCVLAAVRALVNEGRAPRRDLVLAFFADEEAGGALGAGYVTREAPELFAQCREAIGEVGGFSYSLTPSQRAYFVATAEKGVWWTKLTAHGTPGHGSMINPANPINRLVATLQQIHDEFGQSAMALTATSRITMAKLRDLLSRPDASDEEILTRTGAMERMLRAGLRNTINPTQLEAGFKTNVVPGTASVTLDGRFVPGSADQFREALNAHAGPDCTLQSIYFGDAVEASPNSRLLDAISSSLVSEDASAVVVPYMSTAFTDAKWLGRLGIACYGFAPLQLPDDLDFTALFHGVDERVPTAALDFGTRVLKTLLTSY